MVSAELKIIHPHFAAGYHNVKLSVHKGCLMYYDFDLPIIEKLFKTISAKDQTVDAVVYRAKNEDQLSILETLEQRGYIKRKDDFYTLSLVSLDILKNKYKEAGQVLAACNQLFISLRSHYQNFPRENISLSQIVKKTEFTDAELRTALFYLRDAPIWGGYTTDIFNATIVLLSPGESILSYKQFTDIIERLYAWCSDRSKSASFRKMEMINNDCETQSTTLIKKSTLNGGDGSINVSLPSTLSKLIAEIEIGVNTKLNALSAMGMRTVIDVVCNDTIGDIGGFSKKINKLESKGYITSRNKEILNNTLELCHASAHRAHFPSDDEVKTTFQVIIHLINEIYVLESAAKSLALSAPKRN